MKGIDLIDRHTIKYGEKRLFCHALSAFTKKEVYNRNSGGTISIPDYGGGDLHDSVLTNDVVNEIATCLYPVQKPYEVIQRFEKWRKYIDFRRYYLGKQSERCEAITDVSVCDAYMITRETYRRNEETFSELLLDGVKDFGKGEQVILSKEVAGADGFPLICVAIEKNRKEVLSETVGRNGKGKPKFEVGLNRYTRDAMGLSPYPPKSDDKGNVRSIKSYLLGERYLFTYLDIEPDLIALEKKYEKELTAAYTAIDNKYNGIILSELNRYIEKITPAITAKYEETLAEYTNDLEERLDADVRDNSDKEIAKAYQNELNKRLAPIEIERKQKHKSAQAEIDKIKHGKLSQREKDERLEELRVREIGIEAEYAERAAKIKAELSLRDFYSRRNTSLADKKQKSLAIKCQEEIEENRKQKKSQLETQYKADVTTDKNAAQDQLRRQFDVAKDVKIENETIRCYRIYFRPEDATDKVAEIKKQIDALEPKYLTYDNRAEKAKIDRQEKALTSILGGYVKNPFLPTYLFSPEALAHSTVTEDKDPEWCLESLNDRQKLAVKRALQSESIFLLQGPPGTGKTQVIAEITAQLTKRGKKVLISSETHKAIDNVFDRLPKIPEIRPLRLIPSQNGKETNYSPEKLVDNFYLNICGNLEKQIARFDHFEETKSEFDDTMKSLRRDYDCILKLERENAKIDKQRNDLLLEINRLNDESESLRERLLSAKEATEHYNRTLKYVESYRFFGEGADEECLKNYADKVENLLKCFSCLEDVSLDKVGELVGVDIQVINEELSLLLSEDTLVELKNKQKQLRIVLSALRDPETDEAPEEGDDNYSEYKKNQSELIAVGKQIKEYENNADLDISDSIIYALLPGAAHSKELLKQLPKEIMQFRAKLAEIVDLQKNTIESAMDICADKEVSIENDLNDRKILISDKKREYEELGKNAGIEEYGELNSKLKQRITRFFRDFGIIKEYDADNLETAFDIIKDEWKKLESEYNSSSAVNKVKIPMYKDIVKYLSQEDILEEDRAAYTREL
ncbi:MAG: AAA domain-containing protein, partial [Candidatus Scatosoma sp.]